MDNGKSKKIAHQGTTMLSAMQDLKDFDAIFFMPLEDNNVHVQSNVYKEKGTPIEGNSIGDMWHIILFQESDESDDDDLAIKNLDTFEAIFSDPREYISDLIECGWYGIVSRKTTTSASFYREALAKFQDF
jgi:hypothetical protein